MTMIYRVSALIAWAALFVAAAGCDSGPAEPEMADVSGTVMYDGQPIDEGSITFAPSDGGVPRAIPIKGGKYEGEAPVGMNRVQIGSYRTEPNPNPDAPGAEATVTINIIPAKYAAESREERAVTADGPNVFDFTITAADK